MPQSRIEGPPAERPVSMRHGPALCALMYPRYATRSASSASGITACRESPHDHSRPAAHARGISNERRKPLGFKILSRIPGKIQVRPDRCRPIAVHFVARKTILLEGLESFLNIRRGIGGREHVGKHALCVRQNMD